jgi:hypothetical protein
MLLKVAPGRFVINEVAPLPNLRSPSSKPTRVASFLFEETSSAILKGCPGATNATFMKLFPKSMPRTAQSTCADRNNNMPKNKYDENIFKRKL